MIGSAFQGRWCITFGKVGEYQIAFIFLCLRYLLLGMEVIFFDPVCDQLNYSYNSEVVPSNDGTRLFTALYIIFGICICGCFLSFIGTYMY